MTNQQAIISKQIKDSTDRLQALVVEKDDFRENNPWHPTQRINALIGAEKRKLKKLGEELKTAGVKRALL